MAAVFVPDPTLVAQIKIDPGIGETMEQIGEEARVFVVDHAPVETGTLKRSVRRESIAGNGQRISVNVDYWLFPEYGIGQAPHPYLRPVVSALGLNLT